MRVELALSAILCAGDQFGLVMGSKAR